MSLLQVHSKNREYVAFVGSLANALSVILLTPAGRERSGQHASTGVDSMLEALLVDPPCELSD